VLFLLPEELRVLDELAAELGGMSRSELVTHLYELELGQETP
jgi:metal-responsive CopG/Arc/MetJ family transcriptional regulator